MEQQQSPQLKAKRPVSELERNDGIKKKMNRIVSQSRRQQLPLVEALVNTKDPGKYTRINEVV